MQSKFFSAFNAVLSSHLNTPEKCPKKSRCDCHLRHQTDRQIDK